jgi:general secretion pathway protein G
MNKRSYSGGFTIVELLIVIVVIGILAALVIIGYNGIQIRARDADRASDISTLKKKLEIFYVNNGYYPSANDMQSSAFRTNQLDLTNDAVTPSGSTLAIAYCWPGQTVRYCYGGRNADNTDCVTNGLQCPKYWIVYRTEANPTTNIFYST